MLTENVRNDASEKVAVVTGSSKGIGKTIAVVFAKEGYKIVLNARDENELSEAVNDVKKTIGGNEERITWQAIYIAGRHLLIFDRTHNQNVWQYIDVLVNNAGIGGAQKSVHELTSDEWDYVIDVNLRDHSCVHEKQ